MTNEIKQEIQDLLKAFISRHESQAKAVAKLKNVSEATVIQLIKGNWSTISETMFRKIGKQIGWNAKGEWYMVPTNDFNDLTALFEDAQDDQNVYAICAPSGCGKSSTANHFSKTHQNVFIVEGTKYYNSKQFLQKILDSMGLENTGNIVELLDKVVDNIECLEDPVLFIDEADKLKDDVFNLFITLYNKLEDKCGIILMSTDHLQKKISSGLRLNKCGYKEINSRIGRKFIFLRGTTKQEVAAICNKNGITEPTDIAMLYNDYEGDLRRLKKKIHAIKKSRESDGRSNAA